LTQERSGEAWAVEEDADPLDLVGVRDQGQTIGFLAAAVGPPLFPVCASYHEVASVFVLAGSQCLGRSRRESAAAFFFHLATCVMAAAAWPAQYPVNLDIKTSTSLVLTLVEVFQIANRLLARKIQDSSLAADCACSTPTA
jgi:hypothetical protein